MVKRETAEIQSIIFTGDVPRELTSTFIMLLRKSFRKSYTEDLIAPSISTCLSEVYKPSFKLPGWVEATCE